jgi:hypothetical protein
MREVSAADPAHATLDRFFDAYAGRMSKRLNSGVAPGWDFWVVLTEDPKKHQQRRLLVVGNSGGLTVRIADIAVDAGLNIENEASRIANQSIRSSHDRSSNQVAKARHR